MVAGDRRKFQDDDAVWVSANGGCTLIQGMIEGRSVFEVEYKRGHEVNSGAVLYLLNAIVAKQSKRTESWLFADAMPMLRKDCLLH